MYLTEQPFAFDDHHLRIGGKAVLCQSPAEQTVLQLTPIHVGVVKMLNPFGLRPSSTGGTNDTAWPVLSTPLLPMFTVCHPCEYLKTGSPGLKQDVILGLGPPPIAGCGRCRWDLLRKCQSTTRIPNYANMCHSLFCLSPPMPH